jgi:Rhodopirellula transposase DDE domain
VKLCPRSSGFGGKVQVEREPWIRIRASARTWTGWWSLRREEIGNRPFRWTCKSVRILAEELQREGHAVSYQTVAELLHEMDYSLQANQKRLEESQHADRNQQFEYINRKARRYLKQGEPVISVDTKKKELVGDFKNPGREWHPQGQPEQVRVHDFEIRQPENGKVAPYGVYDLGRNVGWVSVGVDHDTAEFAVESIRRWWRWMGCRSYSKAKRLLITADAGGSNGARCGSGNGNCSNWLTKPDGKSRSVTSRPVPANGTR